MATDDQEREGRSQRRVAQPKGRAVEAVQSGGTPSAKRGRGAGAGGERDVLAVISGYTFERTMSKAQRIAHCLDWLRQKLPGTYVPMNVLTKAINGGVRVPKTDSQEVNLTRSALSRANVILHERYGVALVSLRDVGVRATYSDEDTASTRQRTNVSRAVAALRSVERTDAIIDPAKIKDEKLRGWITKNVGGMLKQLKTDDRLARLLPPPKDAKDDSKSDSDKSDKKGSDR